MPSISGILDNFLWAIIVGFCLLLYNHVFFRTRFRNIRGEWLSYWESKEAGNVPVKEEQEVVLELPWMAGILPFHHVLIRKEGKDGWTARGTFVNKRHIIGEWWKHDSEDDRGAFSLTIGKRRRYLFGSWSGPDRDLHSDNIIHAAFVLGRTPADVADGKMAAATLIEYKNKPQ